MSEPSIRRIHIEFQRVQTWLFAVPRLRAMVGANALLGRTLRVDLPGLARETGRGWELAPNVEPYPPAEPSDPLGIHDDPSADARDGILARDGGHFEAQFAYGAETFADAAAEVLQALLPGLPFRVSIDGVSTGRGKAHLSTALPVLAPCEWTGRGVASAIVKQGEDRPSVSLEVARRHKANEGVESGRAVDLASLLCATTKLGTLTRATELNELVGSGYLAIVHADGNGVGRGAGQDGALRARFFHRNRVLLRRALQRAIDEICDEDVVEKDESPAPIIPLMLGGDDLLIVCRARIALPFVVRLCAALAEFQRTESESFELTLGVGVVVAKASIPIHRLHEVAEQLTSSAKRRVRICERQDSGSRVHSVVDWSVYTTSWLEDPERVRQRHWLRGQGVVTRVLSQRPMAVLGESLDSLQGLVRSARELEHAPRSQLRFLVDQLPRGRTLSELALRELSQEARDALSRAGVTELWRQAVGGAVWRTELLDLVEVDEISRLGRRPPKSLIELKRDGND